ncbi:hypothetical protein RF657_15580 [Yersinia rochesterensis]|uniref:hypothetical protein n=1 Tax=Yersinia rochesterensis TaxID=1604335 RepID=UPI002853732F|nr:hypothetical protein [Yersinia rochesterensis]MDR5019807.1 hypothetical protein [Yersinia rochesterensis]
MSENTDYDKACREIARIAAALGIVDYSGDTSEIFDAIILKDEKHQALVSEKNTLYVSLFNHGYGSGHHDTVEGQYTDIHRSDITTYHDDIVGELVEDLLRDMPATTQALNEIKAQGVDEFADELGLLASHYRPTTPYYRIIKATSFRAIKFAASLRGEKNAS